MPKVYGYVRPYPGRLGKQVRDFVEEQGFVLGTGMVVAAGATDVYASRWILRATMDLLVLPFHLHRGDGGQVLDAIGVLTSLPEDIDLGGLPILMPVRAFSWGSSFQRRLEFLKDTRPNVAAQLTVAHQDEIGTANLAARLRRAHDRPASTSPLVRSASVSPPTVRDHALYAAEAEAQRMPLPDITLPSWPASSEPAVSGTRPRDFHAREFSASDLPLSAPRSEPSSLILPRLSTDAEGDPESARERFRRAAEIGQRVNREAAGRKKDR